MFFHATNQRGHSCHVNHGPCIEMAHECLCIANATRAKIGKNIRFDAGLEIKDCPEHVS